MTLRGLIGRAVCAIPGVGVCFDLSIYPSIHLFYLSMPARLVGRGDAAVAQVAASREAVGEARVDAGRGALR